MNKVVSKNGVYGDLTVIGLAYIKNSRSFWRCVCSCGEEVVRRSDSLKDSACCPKCKGRRQSARLTTHGETKTKLYQEWQGIKRRCYSPKDSMYHLYGGRGIKMCDQWKNSYEAFKEDVSKLQHFGEPHMTLDRIDNNGDYEPSNVRWATWKEQGNNRRNNRKLTLNNETHTLSEWSEILNMNFNTLSHRYRQGWSDEAILTTPIKQPKGEVKA